MVRQVRHDLLKSDAPARRRVGCDCAIQVLEFFSEYDYFLMSLKVLTEVVEMVAETAGVAGIVR